jgi:hypothetical protein
LKDGSLPGYSITPLPKNPTGYSSLPPSVKPEIDPRDPLNEILPKKIFLRKKGGNGNEKFW